MTYDPNFPSNLDIKPSVVLVHPDSQDAGMFDAAAQAEAIQQFGIAGRVWEAAYAMNTYITSPPHLDFYPPFLDMHDLSRPLTLLELGSGTGIVASLLVDSLAHEQHIVIATDLPEVCSLLEKNLKRHINKESSSSPVLLVKPLAWGSSDHARLLAQELHLHTPTDNTLNEPVRYLTHIICSDLVYFPELLAPLLRTLLQVTSPPFINPSGSAHWPKVIISYKIRSLSKETPFWSAFGLWFTFEPVLGRRKTCSSEKALQDEEWTRFGSSDPSDSDMFIFVAQRKPESRDWKIPTNDDELLGGVNAGGTPSRKGDDTFESLLLMGLDINE